MALPECFCWSRFGTEAGQLVDQIVDRKEQERVANNGMFFWGIGNAIGPSMRELLRRTPNPEVLFSPIKSGPRAEDVAPPAVVAWTSAETLSGDAFSLPDCSLVTSRQDPLAPKGVHYALVCFSESPLAISRAEEKIAFARLRNLLTGRPVGASQVTAVVQRKETGPLETPAYDIAIRARLVYPYFLRLQNPVLLSDTNLHLECAAVVRQAWEQRRPDQSTSRLSSPES
jgi:hypothetical protein